MGHNEYRLKSLADDELLAGLSNIVGRRNQITAEFLAYLAELDQRQLFLALGFSSLFEYCVEKLGLCESTAGRHIGAARVCRNYPRVFAMVASGALHASALSLMKKHLTPENAEELFDFCTRKSARRVEELLAVRFPKPDVRDLVRRSPTREELTLDVGCAEESNANPVTSEPTNGAERAPHKASAREAITAPAISIVPGAQEARKARRLEPLSADRYGVHFTADGEFRELLERVRGLAGHRLPSGDLMTLMKRGLEAYERELEKERFALGKKPRRVPHGASAEPVAPTPVAPTPNASTPNASTPNASTPNASTPRKRRRCPAAVAREVFTRDGKRCTYVSADGRRCTARRCLELDHVETFAEGGPDTVRNLRLRCRAHNQWYARECFGKAYVEAAVRRARASRPEG